MPFDQLKQSLTSNVMQHGAFNTLYHLSEVFREIANEACQDGNFASESEWQQKAADLERVWMMWDNPALRPKE